MALVEAPKRLLVMSCTDTVVIGMGFAGLWSQIVERVGKNASILISFDSHRSLSVQDADRQIYSQPKWGKCNSINTSQSRSGEFSLSTLQSSVASAVSNSASATPISLRASTSATMILSPLITVAPVKMTSQASLSLSSFPICGQTCFKQMLDQHFSLGCTSPDPSCLCSNATFRYGIRDCSNVTCGPEVAGTVIAYQIAYCAAATAI